jgi:hypothetical protein
MAAAFSTGRIPSAGSRDGGFASCDGEQQVLATAVARPASPTDSTQSSSDIQTSIGGSAAVPWSVGALRGSHGHRHLTDTAYITYIDIARGGNRFDALAMGRKLDLQPSGAIVNRPSKPSRPTSIAISENGGPFELWLETFSPVKEELEVQWAHKLLGALSLRAENLEYVRRGDEPADVLLKDASGKEIHLQIAEAIDFVALENIQLGKKIARLVFTQELCAKLDGLEIEIHHCEILLDSLKQGKITLQEVVNKVSERLTRPVEELPASLLEAVQQQPTDPDEILLVVSRYGSPDAAHPVRYYCMTTPALGRARPDFFTPILRKKLEMHYPRIDASFWLLIYSVDAVLGIPQESRMHDLLFQLPNPFDRIIVLMDEQAVQIFPRCDNSDILSAKDSAVLSHAKDFNNLGRESRWIYAAAG